MAGSTVLLALGVWAVLQKNPYQAGLYAYAYPEVLQVRQQTRTEAFQQEVAFYQERIRRNPQSGLDLAALAATYMQRARVTGQGRWYLLAEQTAVRSLGVLPFFNSGARLTLAEALQARHDFDGALKLIAEVLKAESHNSSARSLRASIRLALGEPQRALQDVIPLVERLPSTANLTLRALVYESLGKDTAALANFMAAIRLEQPDNFFASARVRTLLGRHYARRGELERARGLFQEALRIAPNYPQATLWLADLESRLGNYRSAERLYQQILGLHSAEGNAGAGSDTVYDHSAMRGLARLKRALGSPDETATWDRIEALLRLEVQHGAYGHRRELAQLLLERGRPQDLPEALGQAQLEARIRPDWATLSTLAWAQMRNKQLHAAQRSIRVALQAGIRDAELYYRAGQIEQQLGNQLQAEMYFAQAQEVDPRFDRGFRRWLGLEQ
jgi:tetratricopeptide (TPR) repeat protein